MKKTIAAIAAAMCISCSVYAAVEESGISTENNVYVSGRLNSLSNAECVTICIKNSNNDVKYITEADVDNNGRYEAKFKYRGETDDTYKLYVQDGETNLASTVETAKTDGITQIDSIEITSQYDTDIPGIGDFARAAVTVKNKYKDSGTADIILAYYDDNDMLIGCKKTAAVFDYDLETEIKSDTLKIGEGAKKIKAFVWSSANMMVPLSESKNTDIADVIDTVNPTRVVVAGDSLVHIDGFIQNLEALYDLRYPNNQITFINKGVGGDTSSGLLARFDWDIINDKTTGKPDAVIIAGIGYNESFWVYNGGQYDTDYFHGYVKDEYIKSINAIIDKCNENGIKTILASQSFYDDNANNSALKQDTYYPNFRNGQNDLTMAGRNIAQSRGIPFIDDYSLFLKYENRFLEKEPYYSKEMFTINDRIHQSAAGKLMKAVMYAKSMGMGDTVAEVNIDSNGIAKAINAEVSNVIKNGNEITYTYKAEALPVYYNGAYKSAEDLGFNINDMINREIICVDGLENGTYSIAFDDVEIGSFTSGELAKGVNIANMENNPGQITAKNVYNLASAAKHGAYRNSMAISHILVTQYNIDVNDIDAVKAFVDEHREGINYSGTYVYTYEQLEDYLAQKQTEPQRYSELLAKQQAAKDAAVTERYIVTIKGN